MEAELFPPVGPSSRPRKNLVSLFPHRFFRVRVAYEDVIFSVMVLTLTLLAGFCLGVERGKRLAAHQPLPASFVPVAVAPSETLKVAAPLAAKTAAPVSPGRYAIQLASFLDRHPAEIEADRLKQQGFAARVVAQGRFFELRVVGFRSREEALRPLALLKKMYHDGFIKKVALQT